MRGDIKREKVNKKEKYLEKNTLREDDIKRGRH